jgi:hypothetical protein
MNVKVFQVHVLGFVEVVVIYRSSSGSGHWTVMALLAPTRRCNSLSASYKWSCIAETLHRMCLVGKGLPAMAKDGIDDRRDHASRLSMLLALD